MAKRKKTRQQKIMADKRRETISSPVYSYSPKSLPQQEKQQTPVNKTATISLSSSYKYLAGDLRKTTLFTIGVVVFELILRSFIK